MSALEPQTMPGYDGARVPVLGGAWGWKSTARFYDDLMQAWREGKFAGIIKEKYLGPRRAFAEQLGTKVKQTFWSRGTHTAAWNTLYGPRLFYQLTYETTLWGMLRKVSWIGAGSGYRAVTADISTLVTGIAENGAIPNEEICTLNEVECKPKIMVTPFGIYDLLKMQSRLGDDTVPIEDFARDYYGKAHVKGLCDNLGDTVNTVHTNALESLDRVTSSNAEVNVSDNPPAADDADLAGYLIDGAVHDRDAGTGWTDAQLVHNDGTDRALTLAQMNELHRKCTKAGLKNGVWVTNYEVDEKISGLLEPKQRLLGTSWVTYGINGVQTKPGQDTGFEVSRYLRKPILVTPHIDDTTHEGSRIWMIDLDNTYIKVALPTMLLSTDDADKVALGYFRSQYVYVTMAELVAEKFYSQGKIRDIDIS